jgi:hypothetical protein
MKRFLVALMFALGIGIAFPGATQAGPDLPDPPHPGDLPRPPDPPGPAPRPPAPGELPGVDDDHPWWDPLGLFDDDDDERRGHGHDKHEGKKHKHRDKHDD